MKKTRKKNSGFSEFFYYPPLICNNGGVRSRVRPPSVVLSESSGWRVGTFEQSMVGLIILNRQFDYFFSGYFLCCFFFSFSGGITRNYF